MNIGFNEAMKDYNWTCFIFHDVDLVPEDDRNLYHCPRYPRHMSSHVDSLGYELPYRGIMGGVTAIRTSQFQRINGFSNRYFGWVIHQHSKYLIQQFDKSFILILGR